MKELIKGSGIIFFFKIIGAGALFAINLLISNLYGAKYLGIYNLLFAMLQLSSIFSRAGLDVYVIRIIPSLEHSNVIGAFLKKVFVRVLLLSICLALIIWLGRGLINEYLFTTINAEKYLILISLLIIPFTFFTVIPEILRGFQEIKLYSLLRNASQSLLILSFLGGIIVLEYKDPIYALFLGIFTAFLLAVIILVEFLKKKGVGFKRLKTSYGKPVLRDSYPMLLTSSMLFLMGNVDSFMIGYFDNEFQVCLYNACVRLSFVITFVLASINGFVSPKISKLFHQGDFKNLKAMYYQSLKIIWIVVIPVVVLLYLFPSFFLGLFGEEFKQARLTLIILNTSYLANALFGPVGHILNMTNNHKNVMYTILLALTVNLLGNIIMIPVYGIKGAAIATLASSLVWNFGCFMISKRKTLI